MSFEEREIVMTMHNHIEQRAYPKGYCESCDVVWDALALIPVEFFDVEAEFRVADQLLEDYGMSECLSHLTVKQVEGAAVKFQWDRYRGLI